MIYLDMDGVLCDFVGASCRVHNKDKKTVACWNYMTDEWGMTYDEFWIPINAEGFEFWTELEPTPWAFELIDMVEYFDPNFHICTNPSRSWTSAAGKIIWLQKYLGKKSNWIMMKNKSMLALPSNILIDDSSNNCIKFHRSGGRYITIPQPWNDLSMFPDMSKKGILDYVQSELETIFDKEYKP